MIIDYNSSMTYMLEPVYIGGDAVQTFIVPPSQRSAQKSTETVADQMLIPSMFPGLFPGM